MHFPEKYLDRHQFPTSGSNAAVNILTHFPAEMWGGDEGEQTFLDHTLRSEIVGS